MILFGRILNKKKCIKEAKVENNDSSLDFAAQLENCLVSLCRDLDVPVPIWDSRNTRELGQFQKTHFTEDQFVEKIYFDDMRIEMIV